MYIFEQALGLDGAKTLRIEFHKLGAEHYLVDGVQAHRHWSFWPRGVRRFHHGGHEFVIRVRIHLRGIAGVLEVDSTLVNDDLFSSFNEQLKQRRAARSRDLASRSAGTAFSRVFIWTACFLVAFSAMKACAH